MPTNKQISAGSRTANDMTVDELLAAHPDPRFFDVMRQMIDLEPEGPLKDLQRKTLYEQALADRYPTLSRLADPAQTTVGYQQPELLREAVAAFRELQRLIAP